MLSHEEMIRLQAEKHRLVQAHTFRSREKYVLHLIHTFAYVQAARLAKNKKVLDLGCNTGYGTAIVFKSAKSVVGVDVSEKAISTARKQYGHQGIKFQLIDGKKLPFNDNVFDMIISCQVIEHIVDYEVYISELKRVLSSRGFVMFTTPNAILRLDPGMKPWNRFHVREFNYSELESLLNTFFSEVQICGLFAKEPLYSIEARRVNNERENARKRPNIPAFIRTQLGSVKALFQKSTPAVVKNFMNEHGVEDLSYRANDLESALDLLAICSDNENCITEIQHKLALS